MVSAFSAFDRTRRTFLRCVLCIAYSEGESYPESVQDRHAPGAVHLAFLRLGLFPCRCTDRYVPPVPYSNESEMDDLRTCLSQAEYGAVVVMKPSGSDSSTTTAPCDITTPATRRRHHGQICQPMMDVALSQISRLDSFSPALFENAGLKWSDCV